MLPLLAGLVLILVVSAVKVVRVARAADRPAAVRLGAVMTWVVGTLAVGVLPAFAAFAILDLAAGGFVDFQDGGLDQLGAATLWIGICDAAGIGRLVSPRPEDRGGAADLTTDRRLLLGATALATVAYTVALLIAVGFVDDAHVAVGIAVSLGLAAAAATVRTRPGGGGLGPLTRRPVDTEQPGRSGAGDAGTAGDPGSDADGTAVGDARDPRDAGAGSSDAETDDAGHERPPRRW